jgi:hypothetical protein
MTMTENKTDRPKLADAVRGLVQDEHRALHFLPTEEGLVAYQAGELSPAEEDLVRAYLAVTPEAAEFVADLDAFLVDAEDEAQHLSEHESARVWGKMEGELEGQMVAPSAPPKPAAASVMTVATTPTRSRSGWIAAAAVLFVVAGAGVIWGGVQRARVVDLEDRVEETEVQLAQFQGPSTDFPLLRVSDETRGPGVRLQVQMPPSWKLVFLYLDAPPIKRQSYSSFRLDLMDAQGRTKVQEPAREHPLLNGFTLRLPASSLLPGLYTLSLIGVQGEQEDSLTEAHFEVVHKE